MAGRATPPVSRSGHESIGSDNTGIAQAFLVPAPETLTLATIPAPLTGALFAA
ncbi:hypothetical protein [Streptomyces sp. 2A115]|uniref:hypothetical protein n=1 Tax=Streptomyces sp. 2A115 TaxID=3457439 RepID=UPI003FD37E69